MEERALFLLLLLRQPRLRMIYVTSQPMSESIVEYYLGLLPGVIPSHARARLTLVPVGDASTGSAQLEAAGATTTSAGDPVADPEPGPQPPDPLQHHTARAGRRAVSLGIPMYGADPRLVGPRHQDRLPPDVRGTRGAVSGRSRGPPHGRRHRGRRAGHARATTVDEPGDREAQRRCLGCRQRHRGPRWAAGIRARRTRRAAITERVRGMQPEAERACCRRLSGRLREARRHRRGTDHRQSS